MTQKTKKHEKSAPKKGEEKRREAPEQEREEVEAVERPEPEEGISAPVEAEAAPEAAEEPDEAEELRAQLLRLRADFENFRKRTRREKEEWSQRSLEHICGDLLTVLDHFELGLKNAEDLEVSKEVVKGFELVRGQLKTILGKYGLSEVDAEEQRFDPNLHEAISQIHSPEVPSGDVVAMTRRGYKLGERLLRPAQVVVSQGPSEETSGDEEVAEEESEES